MNDKTTEIRGLLCDNAEVLLHAMGDAESASIPMGDKLILIGRPAALGRMLGYATQPIDRLPRQTAAFLAATGTAPHLKADHDSAEWKLFIAGCECGERSAAAGIVRIPLIREGDPAPGAAAASIPAGPVKGDASDLNYLLSDMDAQKWADEFVKLNPVMDHGLMLTWFSCAVMTGFDEANRRRDRAAPSVAASPESQPAVLSDAQIVAIADKFWEVIDCKFDEIGFAREILAQVPVVRGASIASEEFDEKLVAWMEASNRLTGNGNGAEYDALVSFIDRFAALPAQATPAPESNPVELAPLSTDESREYLIQFMKQHFTDKTFHRYILADRSSNGLAGDFAWQMARALRMLSAPAAPVPAASEGWEVNGGHQPVRDDVRVEVLLRNGTSECGPASHFYWTIDGDRSDIVRWRPAAPATSDKAEG